jgi:hypothetical protein
MLLEAAVVESAGGYEAALQMAAAMYAGIGPAEAATSRDAVPASSRFLVRQEVKMIWMLRAIGHGV